MEHTINAKMCPCVCGFGCLSFDLETKTKWLMDFDVFFCSFPLCL